MINNINITILTAIIVSIVLIYFGGYNNSNKKNYDVKSDNSEQKILLI